MPTIVRYATTATQGAVTGTSSPNWANTANATGNATGTFAGWTSTVSNSTSALHMSGYNFAADIPANATINSVTLQMQASTSTTNMLVSSFQPFVGTTAIGTAVIPTPSSTATGNVYNITPTVLPTVAQLRATDFTVRVIGRKANNTTSSVSRLYVAAVAVTYTLPKADSITFSSWTGRTDFAPLDAARTITNGNLVINTTNAYPATTGPAVDLTGSHFGTTFKARPLTGAGSTEQIVGLTMDTNNGLSIAWSNGAIYARRRVANVNNDAGYLGYNEATHKYVRVREASGQVFWEYSPNGITWSNIRPPEANPFAVTSMFPYLSSGFWGTESVTTSATFGEVNHYIAPPAPKASTLSFSSWSGNGGLFTGLTASAVIAGDNLEITTSTSYSTVQTASQYELTGSHFGTEFKGLPNNGNGTTAAEIIVQLDANNSIIFGWSANQVRAGIKLAGTTNWFGYTAYNALSHRFLRVREAAGTTYCETSADGTAWSTIYSLANPFNMNFVTLMFQSGYYGTETTPGKATFGAVNTYPAALDWGTNTTIDFGIATANGPSTQAEIDEVTSLAEKPRYELWYANWSGGQALSATNLAVAKNRGAVNYVTWEAWDGTQGSTYSYANILAGNHNAYIDASANVIKTFGDTVYLRPFHEMNGTWYPWCIGVNGNTAQQHIDAWNFVRTRFANLGVTNVKWVWSPNTKFPGSPALSTIYPGNANVDVVAIDGYNFGDSTVTGDVTSWKTPQELFDPTYTELRALGINKPYWIGETGSATANGNKATWIINFFKWMTNQADLDAFVWFHLNKERDWRINSSTETTTAFKAGMDQIVPNALDASAGADVTVDPWSIVTVTGTGSASWTQVSGPTVTLSGTGLSRSFVAPPSMSQQTITLAYGSDQMVVTVRRASHGIKQSDGSVLPFRWSVKREVSITADSSDLGTFTTSVSADTSDLGTFSTGLTADTNDAGTFTVPGSTNTPVAGTRLKPTSATQAQMDTSTQTLWNNWKTNIVQKPENGWYAVKANAQIDPNTGISANPYVAEGQGYGLLAAVQMSAVDSSAKTIFDGITKFVLDHPSSINPAFHAAEQDANMVSHNGADSATDGDMDIAYAHLLAHKKWGSAGTYNYLQLATTRINALKTAIISPVTGLLELGDWSSGTWENYSRPSDWMIGHFEAFYAATGDAAWETAKNAHISSVQRLQSTYASVTGLLPDFTKNPPATVAPADPNLLESENDGKYYYNACRTPWRLGVASSQVSRDAALKMATWAKTKCNGNPATLPTGYELDGTTLAGGTYQDLSFIAPFAVGASCGTDQAWLNSLWDYLASQSSNTGYYSGSIQLLCMIAISGTYVVNP